MTENSNYPDKEIKLDMGDGGGANAWADAIRELEGHRPARPQPKEPSAPAPPLATDETAPYIAPDPRSMDPGELIDQCLGQLTEARKMLDSFVKQHPYLVAPNVHRMWADHLQETMVILDRQKNGPPSNGNGGSQA